MYKSINELLSEKRTEAERRIELFSLLPSLEAGDKIYYNRDCYVYYDGENLYNGMDKYPYDTLVKGAFPYIFLLSYVYNALSFAEKVKSYDDSFRDKKLKENKYGFYSYPEIGIVSDNYSTKLFISELEEKKALDEKLVKEALEISTSEASTQKVS